MVTISVWGEKKSYKNRDWGWLHSVVNIINATELYTKNKKQKTIECLKWEKNTVLLTLRENKF